MKSEDYIEFKPTPKQQEVMSKIILKYWKKLKQEIDKAMQSITNEAQQQTELKELFDDENGRAYFESSIGFAIKKSKEEN